MTIPQVFALLAAHAAPDRHTILLVSSSFVANPGFYKKIPYDPFKSFAPVSKIVAAPHASAGIEVN